MLSTILNLPTKVKTAIIVLFGLWCLLYAAAPVAAFGLACVVALLWSVFTIINYLTD
jgi:hypothetical protein